MFLDDLTLNWRNVRLVKLVFPFADFISLPRLRSLCIFAIITVCWATSHANERPGTICQGDVTAKLKVDADGHPLELHDTPVGPFSIFPVDADKEIFIRTPFDVRWVDVRPLSSQIQGIISPDHRGVHLHVKGDTPLTVEFNDDLTQVLHLFPYASSESDAAPPKGVRYFGPGRHDAGTIVLKSGDTLMFAPGAWVRGRISAVGASHIRILGHGVLDVTQRGPRFENAVLFQDAHDITLEGITIFNSHAWTVHLQNSSDVRIKGVRILNPGQWNGDDGIDIDSSSHVVVDGVFIKTNDDCVVVKNLHDVETSDIKVRHSVLWNMPNGGNGIEIGFENRTRPIHDVFFTDLDLTHVQRGAAISIHNGDSGAIEDIHYSDIRVEDVRRKLIDFAVVYAAWGPDRPRRNSTVMAMMDRGGAWDAVLCSPKSRSEVLAANRGHIRNITLERLQVVAGPLPYSVISGFDERHPVEHVLIEGLSYQGRPLRDSQASRIVSDFVKDIVLQ